MSALLRARSAVAAALAALTLAVCGCERGSTSAAEAPAEPPAAEPTGPGKALYLAGDGELTVVEAETGASKTLMLSELSAGDPPYRIVRAGDELLLYGREAVYTVGLDLKTRPAKLARAWFFIPAARPNRVWLAEVDPASPDTVRALAAVREVTVEGRVTVPDAVPPSGRWPVAAVGDGLAFEGARGIEIWDPATRSIERVLPGDEAGAGHGDLLPWCSRRSRRLHVTDVRTGDEIVVSAPTGFAGFDCRGSAFSPDGRRLAVSTAAVGASPSSRSLALVDVARGDVQIVPGSRVDDGYVFVAWAADGGSVFMSGGERFDARSMVAYRLGAGRATRIPLPRVDFYGLAAG